MPADVLGEELILQCVEVASPESREAFSHQILVRMCHLIPPLDQSDRTIILRPYLAVKIQRNQTERAGMPEPHSNLVTRQSAPGQSQTRARCVPDQVVGRGPSRSRSSELGLVGDVRRSKPQARIDALLLEAIATLASLLGAPDLSRPDITQPGCVWQGDRMTAQAALRAALRDLLGPAARAAGFKGSAPTWRSANSDGDWAVVNVQSSSWSTAESLRCVINLAVAPAPWLDWLREWRGSLPKSINESLGLYRDRLHPAGTPAGADGWWQVSSDSDARAAATDMVAQLAGHGWPTLTRLLNRQALLDSIRWGDLGHMKGEHEVFFARAEAVLIADHGPSARLEELLDRATTNAIPAQQANAAKFAAWVRARAARSS